ncbi:unnamed protein product [Rotaria sp. Silwood2]|nr:unnamed protein product [Rotaria sp. Silwood2]CAF3253397.1 unnamed protein product [Rotaria sp. Silwood2]CAF4088451.1 unnamed protein product [Rotaria sp. Silwood2]CAF4417216.1 unnamed protein product [Rotaria sp. Silwood2]
MDVSGDLSPSSSTNTTTSSTATPASSFVNLFLNEINNQDVHGLLNAQQSLLEQLDKTNEKLDGINKLSAKRYIDATRDFSSHTQMLTTMKNDLDFIFKRIKLLKIRLNKKYPESYKSSTMRMNTTQNDSLDEDDGDINDLMTSTTKHFATPSLVKSKTIDCSQFSASMHESYSSTQLANNNNNNSEQAANSFGAVRRFMLDKSSGGQNFSTLFKNARDEFKKMNDGFLGGQNQKPSKDDEQ